jgi:hypothetical protein
MLIDVYKERVTPTGFLRSFFPAIESETKEISIEVQRGTEKIAVDVQRGTEGNRNSFSKSTEKIFVPPYFREYFDATEIDLYDRLFGSTEISDGIFTQFLNSVADKLRSLQDKIERAYELQCAQVLQTGVVLLKKGINIDFKRKAASLVDLTAGQYWTVNGHDPYKDLEAGCNFLRQVGKVQGGMINAILGSSALAALLANSVFLTRQNLFNMALDTVVAPQRNSVGATLHGVLTAGSYKILLWAYPEFYDDANGVSTPYIDPTNVILLPEQPRFKLAFAAVPRLLKDGQSAVKGAYLIGEYMSERNDAHIMDIKSAGVPIPVAVDQIYTVKVCAA